MDDYDVRVNAGPTPPPAPIVDLDDPDVREYLIEQGWTPPSPEHVTCAKEWCAHTYPKGRGSCPFCGSVEPD